MMDRPVYYPNLKMFKVPCPRSGLDPIFMVPGQKSEIPCPVCDQWEKREAPETPK